MNQTLCIQVTGPSGRNETFTVEGERVLIGSAAYCEVRLPVGDASPEHIVIEDAGASGIVAEALAQHPVATIDGVAFKRAPLSSDATLEIGATQIKVSMPTGAAVLDTRVQKQRSNPLSYVAAIVLVPLAISRLPLDAAEESLHSKAAAPALFPQQKVTCPQRDRDPALERAKQELQLADAKRERRPFRAYDGVRAVGSYRMAAACYERAAQTEGRLRAESAARHLERDLEESYSTHRARLEHALSTKNDVLARAEVRKLRDLTRGASGEYVAWLASLERRLALREGAVQ